MKKHKKRPKVNTKCPADKFSAENERIVEFSANTNEQGGLISFSLTEDGKLKIHVYRQGKDVEVTVDQGHQTQS